MMLSLVFGFLALGYYVANGARIVSSLPANASADYVIVGGGLSGMVLAHRLSANGSFSVIVLEAGPDVRDVAEINDPYAYIGLSNDGHYNWLWPTVNQTVGGARKVMYGGKALGGSTSINGMDWTRGTRSQYDAIATLNHDPSWSFDAFFPTLKKAERFYPPSPALHAKGADFEPAAHGYYGPVGVSFVRPYHGAKIARDLVAAAETVFGLARGDVAGGDPNVAAQIATSVHPVGNHSVRSSSANAYLYPLFPAGANTSAVHPGLTVLPGYQATKIVWAADGGADAARATGVEYGAAEGSGARAVVHATREVIVSAGAIMSPAFLQLSGVGTPGELRALGITPVVDLPSVGTNLQDQANGGLYYANLAPAAAANESTGGGAQASANLAFPSLAQLFSAGAAANMSAELRASARTRAMALVASGAHTSVDGLATQLELEAEIIAGGAPVAEINSVVFGGQAGATVWNLIPQYRGTVKLNSSDPFEYPLIDPAYLQTDFDLSVLIAVSQGARRLWAAAPLAGYREPELVPGYSALPLNASDAVWATYIRNVYTPVYHPIGTASMLPRADGGAVDTAFKLYGTTNVRVVDASILPIQLSAHLSATLYGVAEKAAGMILRGQ